MKPLPSKGLYAITDCINLTTEQLIYKTELILKAGVAMLQYRNKHDDDSVRKSQAGDLKKLCDTFNVPLIINDDVKLALEIHADGIHLGKEDAHYITSSGQKMIIGISCYNDLDRAAMAENMGASYIAFGAFYPTSTKNNTVKAEPELIRKAKQILKLPVVAIGGITPENGSVLLDAGADFLAVVSGVYSADNPEAAVKSYLKLFHNA
jgi:thiamine-phosphate pyrophosphorylase